MNAILNFLQHYREPLELQRYGVPERPACVLKTPRFHASRHVVALVLDHNGRQPAVVVKVPRIASDGASVRREAANLEAVHRHRPGGFDSIPRLVGLESYHGYPFLVETALVGPPLDPATVRRHAAACCREITAWLSRLDVPNPEPEADTWFADLVQRPLTRLQSLAPQDPELTGLLEQVRQIIQPLAAQRLPMVFEHGDLADPNLLWWDHRGIGVVDWELAQPRGLPAADLFFFLAYAAFCLAKARTAAEQSRVFQEAFFDPQAWTRPYVLAYADQLELPRHVLPALFVLSWTRQLAGLAERFQPLAHPDAPLPPQRAAWLRENRYYALWRQAVQQAERWQ